MSSDSTSEKPRKTVRKRAVRKSASASSSRVTAKATRTPKKAPSKPVEVEQKSAPKPEEGRKAPTGLTAKRSTKKRKQRQVVVVGLILLLGIGVSAGFGYTDPGVIDVDATIEARNERLRTHTATKEDTERTQVAIPVQNRGDNTKADGGLVGLGVGTAAIEQPPKPQSTTTASSSVATSTPDTASSTDEMIIDSASSTEAKLDEESEEGEG